MEPEKPLKTPGFVEEAMVFQRSMFRLHRLHEWLHVNRPRCQMVEHGTTLTQDYGTRDQGPEAEDVKMK